MVPELTHTRGTLSNYLDKASTLPIAKAKKNSTHSYMQLQTDLRCINAEPLNKMLANKSQFPLSGKYNRNQ